MDRNDRQAIDDLFRKLADVERQAAPRDAESEGFIREKTARQPAAPYYMAQTIVMQERALNAAQARIEELEQSEGSRSPSGGLLGSLFGTGPSRARGSVPRAGQPRQDPYGGGGRSAWQGSGGGGFLAGAAQTAMGVAGGVLLGNAIAGMFGADEAQAAESDIQEDSADAQDDNGGDDGGFDLGGDMGDMEL